MPTFFRLLVALAVIVGLTVAAMAALIHFVEPRQTTMSYEIPLDGIREDAGPRRLDPGVPD